MMNSNGIKATHYALEIAASAALLLTCGGLHGQDIPGVGNAPVARPTSILPTTGDVPNAKPATAPSPADATQATPDPQADGADEMDEDLAPKQAPVTPNVDHETVSIDEVFTVHLRPLFATLVRLPEPVSSLAVGAPTLISAEHDKAEPLLVIIKPTTHKKIDSNVVIALQSGRTLSVRVMSDGDEGSTTPVDFVVDYSQPHALMLGDTEDNSSDSTPEVAPTATTPRAVRATDMQGTTQRQHRGDQQNKRPAPQPNPSTLVTDFRPVAKAETPLPASRRPLPASLLDTLYEEVQQVAAPQYITATELSRIYPEDKSSSADLAAALGKSVQDGDNVVVAYSVLNRSERWIEVLPPLLEFNNPARASKSGKVDKKHPEVLAEQLPINDYRMSKSKLAPGERLDAAVEFVRPGFKYRKERLLLQIANASEVDTALLVPIPFVSAVR
jgi:hypothetical protein